jgi:hypothetical protein
LIRILRVTQRTTQYFLQHASTTIRLIPQYIQGFIRKLPANQVGHRAYLAGTDAGVFVLGAKCHAIKSLFQIRCVSNSLRGCLAFTFATVTAERSRGREFAQLVSNHVLGDQNLKMSFTVMNHERDAHEFGDNCARSRPRLNWIGSARLLLLLLHLLVQPKIDKRTLL